MHHLLVAFQELIIRSMIIYKALIQDVAMPMYIWLNTVKILKDNRQFVELLNYYRDELSDNTNTNNNKKKM